jgi:hypothetical protein
LGREEDLKYQWREHSQMMEISHLGRRSAEYFPKSHTKDNMKIRIVSLILCRKRVMLSIGSLKRNKHLTLKAKNGLKNERNRKKYHLSILKILNKYAEMTLMEINLAPTNRLMVVSVSRNLLSTAISQASMPHTRIRRQV